MIENSEKLPGGIGEENPPESRPLRIWPTFVAPIAAVGLAVAFQAVVAAGLVFVLIGRGVEPSELPDKLLEMTASPGMFLLLAACGQAAFALTVILATHLSPEPMHQRLGFSSVTEPVKVYALTVVGSLLPLAIALAGAHALARVIPNPDRTFEAMFEQITPLWGLAFVLFIALAPGFFEEMLFRGYMQRRLLQRWRPYWAIGVVSVLFALAHVTPHAILAAFPLGLWFGIIAWRTGSIGPGIACHAFVNGGLNTWRLIVKFGDLSETVQTTCIVVFVLLGAVCFVMACRLLARYSPDRDAEEASRKTPSV